jgi:hypothetical protein
MTVMRLKRRAIACICEPGLAVACCAASLKDACAIL